MKAFGRFIGLPLAITTFFIGTAFLVAHSDLVDLLRGGFITLSALIVEVSIIILSTSTDKPDGR